MTTNTQRPRTIADEEWASRWNAIFGTDVINKYEDNHDLPRHRNQPSPQQDMAVRDEEGRGGTPLA